MARTVRDENIGSRNARLSLTPRGKPYFRAIAQGLHLGYRRNKSGNGSWVARRYLGGERYETDVVALADDYRDGNGIDVLTFAEAQRAAARWHDERLRAALGLSDPSRSYTQAGQRNQSGQRFASNQRAQAASGPKIRSNGGLGRSGRRRASSPSSRPAGTGFRFGVCAPGSGAPDSGTLGRPRQ